MAAAIVTRPPGYLFQVGAAELDLNTFDGHVTAGLEAARGARSADAVGLLRAALALWRGPALADIDSQLVQTAVVRLAERRLSTLEECISAELALGRHHEVIGELMELVPAHPLRERPIAQLMTALHRAGRQAEALEAYRTARKVFSEELGLAPGPELQQLQHAILRGTADQVAQPDRGSAMAESVPQVVPMMLPAACADFTGRDRESTGLRRFLGQSEPRSISTDVRIAGVSGPAGIGKTRLAIQVAHEVLDSYPDGQLYVDLRGDQPRPADPVQVLWRFLRALGIPDSQIPDGLDERAEVFRDQLSTRQLLVVLDNVHGEGQLFQLLPGSPSCAVVVTSRSPLPGLFGAHRVRLTALNGNDSLGLLAAMVGRQRVEAEPEHAAELVRWCDGLPLALRVVAARIAGSPHRSIADLARRLRDDRRRLDELAYRGLDVRASIATSYMRLAPIAKRVFRYLGILNMPDFPDCVLPHLLDMGMTDVDEAMEGLLDGQLLHVVVSPTGPLRYRLPALNRIYARELGEATEPTNDQAAALKRLHTTCGLRDGAA